ncbi:MAG: IS66 family transposase [Myxococcota bacterium]
MSRKTPRRSSRKTRRAAKRSRRAPPNPPPRRVEIRAEALQAIVERTREALSEEEHATLSAAIETLSVVTRELEAQDITIGRLRRLLFGPSSEKTSEVVGADRGASDEDASDEGASDEDASDEDASEREPDASGSDATSTTEKPGEASAPEDDGEPKTKGHGRLGATAYTGAEHVCVEHGGLHHGDRCPLCEKGKVYDKAPAVLVRVTGVAPLQATVFELQRLRCNLCGETFTAAPPEGVGEEKYDESAAALLALLRYGYGLPLNRLERLGDSLGIPLPSSTQWDVVDRAAEAVEPVWQQLVSQAADGDVVYIDDTHAQILDLDQQIRDLLALNETDRTGIFTSGVVSTVGAQRMALFFTGRQHAGENLAKVLAQRSEGLGIPIQMSDALSRNTSHDFETLVSHCLAHARRNYVDLHASFPAEVTHVLTELRKVYVVDAEAKAKNLDDAARLRHHKEHSQPVMTALAAWFTAQFDQRRVEPNSTLGKAIAYMQNHWDELTLFLRVEGAPLTNNLCERALKRAILHRKNSLFYKTEHGAEVGDRFMSLIYTAELSGVNPFEYLVALLRHAPAATRQPHRWMPWNYTEGPTNEPG